MHKIVEGISETLTELPPEVAADIYDRGIVLTGGGAQFGGLDDYLRDQTKLPLRVADEPRYTTVRGLEQMFDEPLWLRRVIQHESYVGLDLDAESFNFKLGSSPSTASGWGAGGSPAYLDHGQTIASEPPALPVARGTA